MAQNLITTSSTAVAATMDLANVARELGSVIDHADALARETHALQERLAVSTDEDVRRLAFRIGDQNGWLSLFTNELRETSKKLGRLETARETEACGVPWSICPTHGATLRSIGGRTWCTDGSCSRAWDYDRVGEPCTEPVAALVADVEGTELRLCAGHTLDARRRLIGCAVRPLP